MNIKPNQDTYCHLVTAASRCQNLQEAERLFREAEEFVGISAAIYTSLMLGYTRAHRSDDALAVFKEMKRAGLSPDTAVYTTLINAFRNQEKFDTCWKLYYECVGGGSTNPPDIVLYSSMIKICSYVASFSFIP